MKFFKILFFFESDNFLKQNLKINLSINENCLGFINDYNELNDLHFFIFSYSKEH
jgi:hypothetical protein